MGREYEGTITEGSVKGVKCGWGVGCSNSGDEQIGNNKSRHRLVKGVFVTQHIFLFTWSTGYI